MQASERASEHMWKWLPQRTRRKGGGLNARTEIHLASSQRWGSLQIWKFSNSLNFIICFLIFNLYFGLSFDSLDHSGIFISNESVTSTLLLTVYCTVCVSEWSCTTGFWLVQRRISPWSLYPFSFSLKECADLVNFHCQDSCDETYWDIAKMNIWHHAYLHKWESPCWN